MCACADQPEFKSLRLCECFCTLFDFELYMPRSSYSYIRVQGATKATIIIVFFIFAVCILYNLCNISVCMAYNIYKYMDGCIV